MAHSNAHQPSITKAHQSSSVSPLHPSGSTAMGGGSVEYQIDQRLYQLYENLRACNPSVLIMVNALNVVIRQYSALGPVITTCGDLECFIAAITAYEEEAEL
ncbi:hypothetical protein [Photobacterium iliopiscarium]|uniref:hypothetical protein n=1 Tax=Photobacterium iliopiscarium TaxID=56192 RepID=UPI001E41C4B5|nr:hypothetical protein [Photobacterium iliopiscarium]MCD9468826.1 hypothetical protein [Photobacterium iliopiscarium]MCD9488943.1 hypothetical protein [Photobacterium iliopiscarium]MCF2245659.1 hypothetical protein [Photobacterium iliopiscarium]